MKKIIFLLAAVAALCGACTSSKNITQTFNSVIEVDAGQVAGTMEEPSQAEADIKDDSAQKVYTFLYDSEGNVVLDADMDISSTAVALWEVNEIPAGEYHLVCISFAQSEQRQLYAIEGKSNMSTLKVHQNIDQTFYPDMSQLGTACEKIVIGESDTIKVSLFPASARVNVIYPVSDEVAEPSDTLVAFRLRTNTDVNFTEGEPSFSNPEEMIIPMSSGDSKSCLVFPSESFSYKVSYNLDENRVLEFASDTLKVEKGLQYTASIDWCNKTVVFENTSTGNDNPESVE